MKVYPQYDILNIKYPINHYRKDFRRFGSIYS